MKSQKGFSLIELMVVMVILGIIIGLVGVNVVGRGDEARITAVKTDFSTIENALEMYRLHNSRYPTTDQGLEALVTKPSGGSEVNNWRGPYLRNLPKDPWGNPYVYFNDSGSPEIISFGADGREGGTDMNADISSKSVD